VSGADFVSQHFLGISSAAGEFTEMNEAADSQNSVARKRGVPAGVRNYTDPDEP